MHARNRLRKNKWKSIRHSKRMYADVKECTVSWNIKNGSYRYPCSSKESRNILQDDIFETMRDARSCVFFVIKLHWIHFVPCALYSLCYSFLTAWLLNMLWTTFQHILKHLRMMLHLKDRRTAKSKKKGILIIIDFGVHTPFKLTIP